MKPKNMDANGPDNSSDAVNAFDFARYDQRIVYVKPTDSSLVPGLDGVPAGTTVYTVHLADGTPVAVVGDRQTAFVAARQYNMEPVSLH